MPWIISENITDLEREWWNRIRPIVEKCDEEGVSCFVTHSTAENGLLCPGHRERFQFGDIRIETTQTNIAIEIESEGFGPLNLLKYLPYLEAMSRGEITRKSLVLLHIFGASYPTQGVLYALLEERLFASINDDFRNLFRLYQYKSDMPDLEEAVEGQIKQLLAEEGLLRRGE